MKLILKLIINNKVGIKRVYRFSKEWCSAIKPPCVKGRGAPVAHVFAPTEAGAEAVSRRLTGGLFYTQLWLKC